jgi:hypothetical protein
MRQLALNKGRARMGIPSHVRRAAIPSKGFSHLNKSCTFKHPSIQCVSVLYKRNISSVQVKNKPRVGESKHAFILATLSRTGICL